MSKLISLFTSAGGLDLGFEVTGSHAAVAVEIDIVFGTIDAFLAEVI
jgi:site-specific DNA-cytosine methylase